MREISLTQSKMAIVDDADYEALVQYRWHTQKHPHTFYAVRTVWSPMQDGKRTKETVYMHQQILGGHKGVDHRNRNGLDNRRRNLRPATASQNAQNHRKKTGSSSKFLGVSWHAKNEIWRVRICVDRKLLHLGCYPSELEAAKVYDHAALEHFGAQANTNF